MNTGLRQRVVGALVLVALGVVFLPALLDLGGSYQVDTTSRIPPAPIIEPVQIARASNPSDIPAVNKPVFNLDRKTTDNVIEPSAEAGATEPRLSETGLPDAWVLQVGSFKDKANAQELSERLLKADFQAFVRAADIDGSKNYRVFVGPKVLKDKMLADQRAIEKKFEIKSWLLKFEQ